MYYIQYYSVGMTKPTSHHRGFGLDSDAADANSERKYLCELGKSLCVGSFANFGTFRVFGANFVRQKNKMAQFVVLVDGFTLGAP